MSAPARPCHREPAMDGAETASEPSLSQLERLTLQAAPEAAAPRTEAGSGRCSPLPAGPNRTVSNTGGAPPRADVATARPMKTVSQGKCPESKPEVVDSGAESGGAVSDPPAVTAESASGAESGGAVSDPPAETAESAAVYRWRLAGTGVQNGRKPSKLVVSETELAKEVANKRYRPQGHVKKLLDSHYVHILKKAPSRHKNAKFVCRVCEIHLDSLIAVQKHVADDRHTANQRRVEEMTAVSSLPAATAAQTRALTALLSRLYREEGLTAERLLLRQQTAEQLRSLLLAALTRQFPGTEYGLELFGSARAGIGFETSGVDMALITPGDSVGSVELTQVITVLEKSEEFTEVTHDFHGWAPSVRCVHVASGLRCLVGIGADKDVQLARLLELYRRVDSRVAPLATALRHLARVCEMDRPQCGSLPPWAFVLMTMYFLQQLSPPVLPALHEMTGDVEADLDLDEAMGMAGCWRSKNTASLGALWLQLLHFLAVLFTSTDLVVSLRQRSPLSRVDKAWGNKKISIEDPIQPKRNVARTISSSVVTDVIVGRLRAACLLFGVPRTASGAAICLSADQGAASDADIMVETLQKIPEQELVYTFDSELLCGQTSMPVMCSVCQKAGHVVEACPTLVVPPPQPLPPLSEKQTQLLEQLCHAVFTDWAPPQEEYLLRQRMVEEMESYIRRSGFPTARLQLFGSSCNGFGFRNSDLDICMTLEDCEDPQALDQAEIIRSLALTLSRLRSLHNIIPITTAKVPIVKFTDRRSRLEGDISLYNTLAIHNTMLLHTYAKLDGRARILGYMVKLMAKICDVCDASRGSLSSYAYTLMTIYYLQRCDPPVLPVLQELVTERRQDALVEGCDVSFFADLSELRSRWPQHGRNRQSVGELWAGLLRFYCETFDFERQVVCVRRSQVLTKFEKLWNGAYVAIEDPFLLSHNLAAGVRRKMVAFIRRTLQSWRHHHCTPPKPISQRYRDVRAYLMSSEFLCEGAPPNSNGCHACGRIGHWANDCPRRRTRQPPAPTKDGQRQEYIDSDLSTNQVEQSDSDRAPVTQRSRQDSDRAPVTQRSRQDSDRAPVTQRSRQDSDRAPVTQRSRQDSDRAPVTQRSRQDSDRAPVTQRSRQDSDRSAVDAVDLAGRDSVAMDALQAVMSQLRPAVVGSTTPSAAPAEAAAWPEDGGRQLLALLSAAGAAPPPAAVSGRRVHGVRRAESLERQMCQSRPAAPAVARPPPGFQYCHLTHSLQSPAAAMLVAGQPAGLAPHPYPLLLLPPAVGVPHQQLLHMHQLQQQQLQSGEISAAVLSPPDHNAPSHS